MCGLLIVVLLGIMLPACQDGGQERTGTDGRGVVVLAAGDIASCGSDRDEATAALLEPRATILALGDLAYEGGSAKDFADCYRPSWGSYRAFTRPTPGNHEYIEPAARAYFDTFGATAGPRDTGWYSFELGSWHLVALNSNCDDIGGCGVGSPQERWLVRDLAAHPAACTLAYWHHPRFSSGTTHGGTARVTALWEALYRAGAELVLTGHEHNYERFAMLDDRGQPDSGRGIRQFVVGTGGYKLYPFGPPVPGSEFRDNSAFGVLRLVLDDGGFDWEFISVDGRRVIDVGSDRCR